MIPEGFDWEKYQKYPSYMYKGYLEFDAYLMPWGSVRIEIPPYTAGRAAKEIDIPPQDIRGLGEFLIACADAMGRKDE